MLASKFVLASGNAGKLKEFQALLPNKIILTQNELRIESIEETGLTFIENALLKARHASQASGLPALADDSGLVVPALGGEPGIYSARYAGKDQPAHEHYEKLLQQMTQRAKGDRQAYFYCCLVYLRHPLDPCPLITEGKWFGEITDKPRGKTGFGYDPVFYLPELECTAAELSPEQKNRLSHRGQALRLLIR